MLSELFEADIKLMKATFHAIWANCSPAITVNVIKKCTQGLKKSLALTAGNYVKSMTISLC